MFGTSVLEHTFQSTDSSEYFNLTSPPEFLNPPPEDPTRLRLLEAAEEVFADVGFEAATVRDICQKANVKNIGAVNYYFQGKERLYQESVMLAFQTCQEGAPFPQWEKGTPAEEKLRDFIRTMMARMVAIPRISSMRLMMREMTDPSPACSDAVNQNIKPMADMLHGIFAELLPKVPLDRRWLIGFSVVGQCLFYRQNRAILAVLVGPDKAERMTDAELLAEHVIQFTFAALGLAPPVSESYRRKS
jgi:AcrR family transcriptional regulator